MQLICKVGTRYPDPNDPRHFTSWRDGQIIAHTYNGHVALGTLQSKHHCIIQIPNADYWKLRGSTDWKSTKPAVMNFKKYICGANLSGKYNWELTDSGLHTPKRERDFFVDYKWLVQEGYITQAQYEDIYNQDKVADIQLPILDWTDILKHEDIDTHLDDIGLLTKGSVSAGTFQIGTGGGADYATWDLFFADWAAQMTNDLKGEGQDEETATAQSADIYIDTNGYKLTITTEVGAENGGTYSGCRVNFGTSNKWEFDESSNGTFDDFEISKIAMDCTGGNNYGIRLFDGGDNGSWLANRMYIKGGSTDLAGLYVYYQTTNVTVRNNILHGFGDGDGSVNAGLFLNLSNAESTSNYYFYNNTCCKNYNNFRQYSSDLSNSPTIITKNNLCQGNLGGSDYLDAGAGFGTTAKNYGESDSPDALTENFHDGTSNFTNYDGNDYTMASGGDAITTLKAGEDLTGIFTDSIAGRTRQAATFFIGADWIETEVGGLSIPVAMHHYTKNIGSR